MAGKLVLCRHGQSTWNKENLFTGWSDVDLTNQGIKEARQAGKELLDLGLQFDIAYTSLLKRAIRTLWLMLDEMDQMWIPVTRAWELNERSYGDLQGLSKTETALKHGDDQVHIWRRSFDIPPPPLQEDDKRHPRFDLRYKNLKTLPATESLKDTLNRVGPYFKNYIQPRLKSGENILISAHGNSLRALVKMLEGISDKEITNFNIPTGIPILYELDKKLIPLNRKFLGDEEAVKKASEDVANQAKK
ncbi:MAG: 2,3-diphosphoglycerate-dependent phosphoglycerate mutase [Pseudomonadota bacterium]|nr:2,3-diphosphoglycerate-dependent phosphoglycerate mutase [Pseudomonadota bacterium]